jgi:uncharacterized membrane protein
VILLIAALFLAGSWEQKSPCLHTNPGWSNGLQYRYACYSDVIPIYGIEGFEKEGMFPYQYSWLEGQGTPSFQVRHTEYPVLTGLLMWVSSKITHWYQSASKAVIYLPRAQSDVVFFDVCALFASVFWLISMRSLTRMTRKRVWDGAIAAASPLILVQAFTNWDMLAVVLATTGMYAWSRKRPVLAGALIGLGAAAKLYPVLMLIPLFALCLRAGRMREWGRAGGAALLAWAFVNAPIAARYPAGWYEFFRLNSQRGPNTESIYNMVSYFTGWGGFDGPLGPHQAPRILNAVIAVTLICLCGGIALVALSAPRRPRFAQLALLTVSAFLLTNKVWSPQYSLWLIPLAVLAVPRWKPLLVWMLVDAAQWYPQMRYSQGTNEGGWTVAPLISMVILRDLLVAGLCALVIYEIYHPARDLVRRSGDDDPTGGVLEDAPDVFVLTWRRVFGRRRPGGRLADSPVGS